MKGKTIFKLLLDLSMTVLYILLMFGETLGGFFHEVLGIGIGLLFLVHVLMNRKAIGAFFKAIKGGNYSGKTMSMFILDLLLIVGMPVVIVTGVLISGTLFNTGITAAWALLFEIHKITSYVCLGTLAVHLLLHARYMVSAVRAAFLHRSAPQVRKTAGRFAAGTMAACIIYTLAFMVYKNNIVTAAAASSIAGEVISTQTIDPNDTTTEIIDNQASASNSSTEETDSQASTSGTSKSDDGSQATTTQTAAVETLNEFLSKLYCTGCHNHCPLSSPLCARSAAQIEEATTEYYETYADQIG